MCGSIGYAAVFMKSPGLTLSSRSKSTWTLMEHVLSRSFGISLTSRRNPMLAGCVGSYDTLVIRLSLRTMAEISTRLVSSRLTITFAASNREAPRGKMISPEIIKAHIRSRNTAVRGKVPRTQQYRLDLARFAVRSDSRPS